MSTQTIAKFPENLHRTLFPGYVGNSVGDIFLSGEIWAFDEIDRVLPQLQGYYGDYDPIHDLPDKTTRKAAFESTKLDIGVKPAWIKGCKKALGVLERLILKDPEAFFGRKVEQIQATIITTQAALATDTGIKRIQASEVLCQLANKVAGIGSELVEKKIPPVLAAAKVHHFISQCSALGPVASHLARIWANTMLQVGGVQAVMFPSEIEYLEASKAKPKVFATYLEKVIGYNDQYKVFA